MDQGLNKQQTDALSAAVLALLVASYQQDMQLFAARAPHLYEQLRRLVQRCRHHLRSGNQSLAQSALQDGLFRLFAVQVTVPPDRQLSILASVIRHLLVDYLCLRQQMASPGAHDPVSSELCHRLTVKNSVGNLDVLVIDAALDQLAEWHPVSVCLLELRYFARLSMTDMALELGASVAAIKPEFRFARAWLVAYTQIDAPLC